MKLYYIPNKEGTPQRVSLNEYRQFAKEINNGRISPVCSYVAHNGSGTDVSSEPEGSSND